MTATTLGAPITFQQWSSLLVQQLQLVSPAVSAQTDTPERLIIDTVASALSTAQIDLTGTANSNSLDSKTGSDLDVYVGLFGFARQKATYATGTVTVSTSSPATIPIGIPYGTRFITDPNTGTGVVFDATETVAINIGDTSVDVSVRAEIPGTSGNVPAGSITGLASNSLITGITSITQTDAISNAANQETDSSLKTRFKNQVFRNVSGTVDQYLATGLSGLYSTKANCIGPISRYREYIQCPSVDDASIEWVSTGQGYLTPVNGANAPAYSVGQYTTGLSSISYAKYIWTNVPAFVSNGSTDSSAIFYQPGIDWVFNTTVFAKNRGDAYRFYEAALNTVISPPSQVTITLLSESSGLTAGVYSYAVTAFTEYSSSSETDYIIQTNPSSVTVTSSATPQITWNSVNEAQGYNIYRYFGSTWYLVGTVYSFEEQLTFIDNVTSPPAVTPPTTNTAVIPFDNVLNPATSPYNPNVTFINVYTGDDDSVNAVTPGSVNLFEWSYTSTESRNDYTRGITNCVDLFVDGQNSTSATISLAYPNANVNVFENNNISPTNYTNYQRLGQPGRNPVIGNIMQSLMFSPIIDVPSSITVTPTNTSSSVTYYQDIHYFGIQEIDDIGGTVQSRDGLEWVPNIPGQWMADPAPTGGTTLTGVLTGPTIVQNTGTYSITYDYDKNIVDLQSACEGIKQSTTNPLVHTAQTVYFKLDITVIYASGSNITSVNSAIQTNIQNYLSGQYFGTIIQLSTLLNIIYNTSGVQNVRWTHDLDDTKPQVQFTDVNGNSLCSIVWDRNTVGANIAFTATATSGSNTLTNVSSVNGLNLNQTLTLVVDGHTNTLTMTNIDPVALTITLSGNVLDGTGTSGHVYTANSVNATLEEIQQGIVIGNPTSGTFTLSFNGQTTKPIQWISNLTTLGNNIVTAINSQLGLDFTFQGVTGEELLFQATSPGLQLDVLQTTSSLLGGNTQTGDFNLKDNQLPSLPTGQLTTDTVPGLIIRQKAQDTFNF